MILLSSKERNSFIPLITNEEKKGDTNNKERSDLMEKRSSENIYLHSKTEKK